MLTRQKNYEKLAAVDMESRWEIHKGEPREKPSMSYRNSFALVYLGHQLLNQLNQAVFQVRINIGHVSRGDTTYYVPDVFVLPATMLGPDRDRPDVLEVYSDPLPLVVEVWSPSTGSYDRDAKLPEYRRRGDVEIWRLHPFDRSLTAWRRQPNGSYTETVYHGGTVQPSALPNVTIDLDALFGAP
ncbi:MAG: Uma2 family endonuclease [Thermomicrobiales bacterium]